jgi:hypothetical protein
MTKPLTHAQGLLMEALWDRLREGTEEESDAPRAALEAEFPEEFGPDAEPDRLEEFLRSPYERALRDLLP